MLIIHDRSHNSLISLFETTIWIFRMPSILFSVVFISIYCQRYRLNRLLASHCSRWAEHCFRFWMFEFEFEFESRVHVLNFVVCRKQTSTRIECIEKKRRGQFFPDSYTFLIFARFNNGRDISELGLLGGEKCLTFPNFR